MDIDVEQTVVATGVYKAVRGVVQERAKEHAHGGAVLVGLVVSLLWFLKMVPQELRTKAMEDLERALNVCIAESGAELETFRATVQ